MHLRPFAPLLAACLLVACGGGGGGDDSTPPTPVTNAKQGGVYTGALTPTGQPAQRILLALVSETGETRLVTSLGTVFSAQLGTTGTAIAGNFRGIAPPGIAFGNGRSNTTGTASGTVAERSRIDATYTAEAGDRGSLALAFRQDYTLPSSLARVSGTYGYSDGSYTVTYVVRTDGTVSGSDTDGCNYVGTISLLDTAFNLYRLSATTNCATGTFNGLATLTPASPSSNTPEQLYFILTTDTQSYFDFVDRK